MTLGCVSIRSFICGWNSVEISGLVFQLKIWVLGEIQKLGKTRANAYARDLPNFGNCENFNFETPRSQNTCAWVLSGWRGLVRSLQRCFNPNMKSVSVTWRKSEFHQIFENRKFGIWWKILWTPGIKIIFWWEIVKWKTWPHFYWIWSNISQIGENLRNFEVTAGIWAYQCMSKIRDMRTDCVISTWCTPDFHNSRG